MYKVFFNGSCIQLDTACKTSSKDNIVFHVDFIDYDFVNQIITSVEQGGGCSDFVIVTQQPDLNWKEFKKCFSEIPAAGGVVKNSDGNLLFIKRLGVWDLPKGKIEKNETSDCAAVREVEEECGLSGMQIVKKLNSTYHIYRSPYLSYPNNLVLKETSWYLMNYFGSELLVPQIEEDIEEARWFSLAQLDVVMQNTYPNIRELLYQNLPVS